MFYINKFIANCKTFILLLKKIVLHSNKQKLYLKRNYYRGCCEHFKLQNFLNKI